MNRTRLLNYLSPSATAYVFKNIFDEYTYQPAPLSPSPTQDSEQPNNVTFEIQINTLIECLNIFGSGGISHPISGTRHKKWRKDDGGNSDGEDDHGNRNAGPIDKYFGVGGPEKRTSMRMSYVGIGHPLTLLV